MELKETRQPQDKEEHEALHPYRMRAKANLLSGKLKCLDSQLAFTHTHTHTLKESAVGIIIAFISKAPVTLQPSL